MAIWDYKAHGGVCSAVSDEQIRGLIQQGTITRDTEIAKTGTERWQAVGVTTFRKDCERAEAALYRGTRGASLAIPSMPNIGSARVGFAAFVWIALTIAGLLIAWHDASSYDPNKNGTFNMAEAAILNSAWTQVVAQFIGAALLFGAFATFAIVNRLTLVAQVNRAGHLAMVEEVRSLRALVARDQPSTGEG